MILFFLQRSPKLIYESISVFFSLYSYFNLIKFAVYTNVDELNSDNNNKNCT